PALATPATLDVAPEPIEVAQGFGATIPVKLIRTKGSDGTLAVSALALPPGVTIPGDASADKAADGKIRVQAALEAPLGTPTLAPQAKGKIAGADRVLIAPAVNLSVVRPASLELARPGVEVKPGAAVEVKGRIVRKGTFSEPVGVRVNGLPSGLKSEPATVA